MGVIGDHKGTSISFTLIKDHKQSQASKNLNPSMNKLSVNNETSHRNSRFYAIVV